MTKRILATAALLVAFSTSSTALAGPIISNVSGGGGPFSAFYGDTVLPSGDAVGYRFTADANLEVTDLGIVVDPEDGVLDSTHTVGLWRVSDQALLGSASVDATGTLLDGFIYTALGSSIMLTGGEDYVLAALYAIDDDDFYLSGPTFDTDNVSMTAAVFPAASNLGLTYPSMESVGNPGRVGPNMIANLVDVPEPTTLALLGLGLTGLAARRRRLA